MTSNCIGDPENFLCMEGRVRGRKKVLDFLLQSITLDCIDITRINEAASKGVMYLTEDVQMLKSTNDEEARRDNAYYKVVSLGYLYGSSSEDICASFSWKNDIWNGIFLGRISEILRAMCTRWNRQHTPTIDWSTLYPSLRNGKFKLIGLGAPEVFKANNQRIGETELSIQIPSDPIRVAPMQDSYPEQDVIKLIYENMEYSKAYKPNWRVYLNSALRILLTKIGREQRVNPTPRGNGYVLTENRETALINTGWINKYGADILLVDHTNSNLNISEKRVSLVQNSSDALRFGFLGSVLREGVPPIKFYSDYSELVFNPFEMKVELQYSAGITHICEERKDRLPKEYRQAGVQSLYPTIVESLRKALKRSERDPRYIFPRYQASGDNMSYLVPLIFPEYEKPVAAIVLAYKGCFYEPTTVLTLEDAYRDALLTGDPVGSWLDVRGGA